MSTMEQEEYQTKINSLQKFVPLLKQFIDQLQQAETKNAEKVLQLQSYQNILLNAEPSASLDKLNECEQALQELEASSKVNRMTSEEEAERKGSTELATVPQINLEDSSNVVPVSSDKDLASSQVIPAQEHEVIKEPEKEPDNEQEPSKIILSEETKQSAINHTQNSVEKAKDIDPISIETLNQNVEVNVSKQENDDRKDHKSINTAIGGPDIINNSTSKEQKNENENKKVEINISNNVNEAKNSHQAVTTITIVDKYITINSNIQDDEPPKIVDNSYINKSIHLNVSNLSKETENSHVDETLEKNNIGDVNKREEVNVNNHPTEDKICDPAGIDDVSDLCETIEENSNNHENYVVKIPIENNAVENVSRDSNLITEINVNNRTNVEETSEDNETPQKQVASVSNIKEDININKRVDDAGDSHEDETPQKDFVSDLNKKENIIIKESIDDDNGKEDETTQKDVVRDLYRKENINIKQSIDEDNVKEDETPQQDFVSDLNKQENIIIKQSIEDDNVKEAETPQQNFVSDLNKQENIIIKQSIEDDNVKEAETPQQNFVSNLNKQENIIIKQSIEDDSGKEDEPSPTPDPSDSNKTPTKINANPTNDDENSQEDETLSKDYSNVVEQEHYTSEEEENVEFIKFPEEPDTEEMIIPDDTYEGDEEECPRYETDQEAETVVGIEYPETAEVQDDFIKDELTICDVNYVEDESSADDEQLLIEMQPRAVEVTTILPEENVSENNVEEVSPTLNKNGAKEKSGTLNQNNVEEETEQKQSNFAEEESSTINQNNVAEEAATCNQENNEEESVTLNKENIEEESANLNKGNIEEESVTLNKDNVTEKSTTLVSDDDEADSEPILIENNVGEESSLTLNQTNVEEEILQANGTKNLNGSYDPLNCSQSNKGGNVGGNAGNNAVTNVADDDDDVEIIETRASPICLDSDDDEPQAIPVTVTKERSFARKSTAKPPTAAPTIVSTQTSSPNNVQRPRVQQPVPKPAAVTTIELLDSSDDEAQKVNSSKRARVLSKAYHTLQRTSTTYSCIQYPQPPKPAYQPSTMNLGPKRTLLPSSKKKSNNNFLHTKSTYTTILAHARSATQRTVTSVNYPPKPSTAPKRTLLPPTKKDSQPKNQRNSNTIVLSSAERRAPPPTPIPVYVPTPQTNFMNAINLQPTYAGVNPQAFSAKLSNKNVIIPNAFYGNPPEMRTSRSGGLDSKRPTETISRIEKELVEQSHCRWLENFVKNFANPQQVATNLSFELLESVLSSKLFTRIRERRKILNTVLASAAHTTIEQVDIQLMLDLRNAFYTSNSKQLSEAGRRFCESASTAKHDSPKNALTTELANKRITSSLRTVKELNQVRSNSKNVELEVMAKLFPNSAPGTSFNATMGTRKRQSGDDIEYMPSKPIPSPAVRDETTDERKRSLRTKRTRRYDHSFSYNEEDDDFDELVFEDTDQHSYEAIQRKIERKRLEAQRQREQQAMSFEKAFSATLTNEIIDDAGDDDITLVSHPTAENVCFRINNNLQNLLTSSTSRLTPTDHSNEIQVIPDDDDEEEVVKDVEQEDEPKPHRIYKVIPTKLTPANIPGSSDSSQQQQRAKRQQISKAANEQIVCESVLPDSNDDILIIGTNNVYVDPAIAPKNIDRDLHMMSSNEEWCVLCKRRVTRIVHHYVNDHRGCEVYNSRLSSIQVHTLILPRNRDRMAEVSLYKNGQPRYEASCAFCQKPSRFMLMYWYQHYAMHTGEYAYRCNGCGIRKPTRSLLTQHTNQPCPQGGEVCREYAYDRRATKIVARICTLCNYVQLNRINVYKHLQTQHNIKHILARHTKEIVLLNVPPITNLMPYQESTTGGANYTEDGDNAQQENMVFNYDDSPPMPMDSSNDDDPSDDLSFMICGMLDVEMRME